MVPTTLLLLALTVPAVDDAAKKPDPAARVTITAEVACLHCTFGQGDGCAACLALDDKTPVVLEGKAAKQFVDERFSKKVLVVEGVLSINKDKRLVLTSDDAHVLSDKDKGKAPAKGEVRIVGTSCCAHCDLGVAKSCAVAIKNATFPVVLQGKLAEQCNDEDRDARVAVGTGKLSQGADGQLRLDVKQLTIEKKAK
jgi:hypothetical protein